MTLFTENLPLIVVVNKGLPDEKKYQGVFRQIISSAITVFLPTEQKNLPLHKPVHIVFYIKQLMFEFQANILQFENQIMIIDKPQKIEKNRQRVAKRLHVNIPAQFTAWTKIGSHQGEIINVSSVGCRLASEVSLEENDLISLVWVLKGGDKNYDFSTQGLVVWRKDFAAGKSVYGIKFTTLSEQNESLIDHIVDHYEHSNKKVGGVEQEQSEFLKTAENADANSLHYRFQQGLEKLQENKVADAEKYFLAITEDSTQKDPYQMQEKSFVELQKIYIVQKRFIEAIKCGAKFLEKYSSSELVKQIVFHIALAYEGMGNSAKAIDYYDKVEKLLPFEKINENAREKIKQLSAEV